jgi:hypothetical protein|tara:strand:- start:624 stop:749 length:126 start_codon:yes stop_codon:yes gene_type:complete
MFENTGQDGKPKPSSVMAEILAVSGESAHISNDFDIDDFDH